MTGFHVVWEKLAAGVLDGVVIYEGCYCFPGALYLLELVVVLG